jgi:hypothetical protein
MNLKKIISFSLLLTVSQAFSQNVWNGSTIESTTLGNLGVGAPNINARINVSNTSKVYGIYNQNTGALSSNQFGIFNYLSTGTSTGTKYGIYNVLTGSSLNKYGIYSSVTNTSTGAPTSTPTAFGVYAKGTGDGSRAGYFEGNVEYSGGNSMYSSNNGTKTIFATPYAANDYSFTIALNMTNSQYDWDWTNSLILNRNGSMVKRINTIDKAFSIERFGQGDVFRIYGDGKMYATTVYVKLATQFPDYVFKPEYELMPLSEVKAYISKNGHLPKFADAETVVKDGMDVGAISVTLVEKVEELTLYMIQLKERIDLLEAENVKLKERINK